MTKLCPSTEEANSEDEDDPSDSENGNALIETKPNEDNRPSEKVTQNLPETESEGDPLEGKAAKVASKKKPIAPKKKKEVPTETPIQKKKLRSYKKKN